MALFSFTFDNVEVLDQSLNQLFSNARMMRALVRENSKPFEHPIETGSIITDHRIILPTEIDLVLTILPQDVKDIYAQIKDLFLKGTLVIVQTRSSQYKNLYIQALPHRETPERLGVIDINLRLKEAQFASSQSTTTEINPSQPSNSDTVDRGVQQATDPVDNAAAPSFSGGA